MNIKYTLVFCLISIFVNFKSAQTGPELLACYNVRYQLFKEFSKCIEGLNQAQAKAANEAKLRNYMLHLALNFENRLGDEYSDPLLNSVCDRIAKAVALIEKGCSIDSKNNAGKTPLDLFFDSIKTQKLIKSEHRADFEKLFTAIKMVLATYSQTTRDDFLSKSQEVLDALSPSKPSSTTPSVETGDAPSPIQTKLANLKKNLSELKNKLESLIDGLTRLKGKL